METNATLNCELIQLKNIISRMEQFDGSMSINQLIPKKAASGKLGVSLRTIERWCVDGYIRRIKIGGRIYFHQSEIDRIINCESINSQCKTIGNQPLFVDDIVRKYRALTSR